MSITRRSAIIGLPLLMGGCAARLPMQSDGHSYLVDPAYISIYGAIDTEPYPVPAIDLSKVKPQYYRRLVAYRTTEPPGTIVVDPNARYCYFIQENGKAVRYGVGVGKVEAFNFKGEAVIARKATWPHWTPTSNMIARDPKRYGPVKAGLSGGEGNPLGPRALYLYRDGIDTFYRLHGTVEPWTIGTRVSSGCIRLLNQDILDLYNRVVVGTRAIVLPIVPSGENGQVES